MDCNPPASSVHKISQEKNAGVSCHARFQGIFLTQGLNQLLLRLLHQQSGSLPLVPPGKPRGRGAQPKEQNVFAEPLALERKVRGWF